MILLCVFSYLLHIRVRCAVIGKTLLPYIAGIDYRLSGKQSQTVQKCGIFLFGFKVDCELPLFQMSMKLFQKRVFFLRILIVVRKLLRLCHPPVQNFQVGENELQLYRLNIPNRIYRAVHMNDIVVIKATNHVHDGIRLPNIPKELISEAFSLGSALHQSRNIHKLDYRRCNLLGMIKVGKKLQTLIRNRHHAHIRVNGTEGVVCRLRTGLGNGIKEGGLSHIWQTYDS